MSEKLISLGFALPIVLLCTPNTVIDIFITMGNAHTFLAFLYLYKAGRVTPFKTLLLGFAVILLFGLGYYQYNVLTMIAAGALIFHVYAGELKFLDRPYTLPYFMLTVCIFTITSCILAMALWTNFEPNMYHVWIPVLIAAFIAIGLYFYERKTFEVEMFFVFLVLLLGALFVMEITGNRPRPVMILAFIVLTHYMTFYVHFARFLYLKNKQKFTIFSLEVILANVLSVIGWILVFKIWQSSDAFLYKYYYTMSSFFVWTLAHFISTFRIADYKLAFSLKMPEVENKKSYA